MLFNFTVKLSYLQRAQLYTQLATLTRAGIAAAQCWKLIDPGPQWRTQIAQIRRALERGLDVAGAGERAGIFLPLDAALIRATQQQGDLSLAYHRLAQYYQQRALQWQKIRSRLLLPALMLMLALLIRPLPALILGQLSVAGYLWQVLVPPCLIAILILLGRSLLQHFQLSDVGNKQQRNRTGDQLLLFIPLFGKLHQRRCLADFWHGLAMLLEAGMPMFEAYKQAIALVNNQALQLALQPVLEAMEQGQSFNNALALCVLFQHDQQVRALVSTGEASGSLPEMLARLAVAEDEALAYAQQQLSLWLPRLVYAVVATWIAYCILQGAPLTSPAAVLY